MIIAHISDTHGGNLPETKSIYDIVVHSGDFLPDFVLKTKNRDLNIEQFQSQHLHAKAKKIKGWLKDRKFLFCTGNHDFLPGIEIEKILQAYDINAFCLNDTVVEIDKFKFYGFPYIPFINGSWSNEPENDVLKTKVKQMCNKIKYEYIDVLVAHAPPYGILDLVYDNGTYRKVGNYYLTNEFEYSLLPEQRPKWILCGHIHRNYGISSSWVCNVSNAATTMNLIHLL